MRTHLSVLLFAVLPFAVFLLRSPSAPATPFREAARSPAQAGGDTVETPLPPAQDTMPVPADEVPPAPVLSPEEALADFQVGEGFAVELVAAEPDVVDPVALAFDAGGAIWVVEMRAYMDDVEGSREGEPLGRIAVLRDEDQDGYYERHTTFLDSLVMPRAIALVEGGILVAEPPNLFFVESNDYRAGQKVLVDSTYAVGGNPEHQPNGLVRGLDNWIYSAKSDRRYRRTGGRWVKEETEFRGQWGLAHDDYGRFFYNNNSQTLLGDNFLPNAFPRNPHHTPEAEEAYGAQKASNRVYPRRVTPGVNRGYQPEVLDSTGRLVNVTSASGPTVYRGALFPPAYRGNAFVPEPAAHAVIRVLLEDETGRVSGRRAYEGREFLTATDERFRPVTAYSAPDGSLYLVDMYQGIIQHKTYLTDYLRRQIALRGLDEPDGLGRIYRIVPQDTSRLSSPRLKDASSEALVSHLTHPNGWWRDTAQRLLIQRGDRTVLPALRALAADDAHPLGQIHALWTLEGLQALTLDALRAASSAPGDPKVLTTATRLAEEELAASEEAREALALIASLQGHSEEVDRQVALSLHAFRDEAPERVFALLAGLAADYGDEPVFRDAILGGLEDEEEAFSDFLERRNVQVPPAFADALAAARMNAQTQPAAQALALGPKEQAVFDAGQALYQRYCMSCHGEDGTGLPAMAPPLVASKWVLQRDDILTRLVLDGMTGPVEVAGRRYTASEVMPTMPGIRQNEALSDADVAAILTFIRNAWGNRAPAVDPEAVAHVRRTTQAHAQEPYTADELDAIADTSGGWEPLFDGETLAGWHKLGGDAIFEAENGMIVGTAVPHTPNTFLATEEHYGDFILEFDVRVDPPLNSGVQIRSNSYPGYRDGRVHGYQVEIDPSERAWSGGIYDEARRGWLFDLEGNEAARQAFDPEGWNHFRVEARGPHLRTWVNGVLAADLVDPRTASGFIALQVHSIGGDTSMAGKTVRWRDLRLRALDTLTVAASLDPAAAPITAATDSDPATYWRADGAGQWITVDLREPTRVSGVAIDFHRGDERRYRFEVALSEDGEAWREVFSGTSAQQDGPERFVFPPQEARYVRITGQGNSENEANAYSEISVLTGSG